MQDASRLAQCDPPVRDKMQQVHRDDHIHTVIGEGKVGDVRVCQSQITGLLSCLGSQLCHHLVGDVDARVGVPSLDEG